MFLGSHPVLIIKMFKIKIRTFCQEYGFLPSLRKSVLATLGPPSWVASSPGTEWWLPLSDGREFLALPQSLPLLITLPHKHLGLPPRTCPLTETQSSYPLIFCEAMYNTYSYVTDLHKYRALSRYQVPFLFVFSFYPHSSLQRGVCLFPFH